MATAMYCTFVYDQYTSFTKQASVRMPAHVDFLAVPYFNSTACMAATPVLPCWTMLPCLACAEWKDVS